MDQTVKGGFATFPKEKFLKLCSEAGRKAHALGRSHQLSPEETKAGGLKGGAATVARYGNEHMREIGRRGGLARAAKAAQQRLHEEVKLPLAENEECQAN